jgi:hypothetical protein
MKWRSNSMQHPLVQIDLAGQYPNRIHSPALFAQSQATQQNVYLLLDTGHSKECSFETEAQATRFKGDAHDSAVTIGPITAVNPLPGAISYGEFLGDVHLVQGNLARGMQLSVTIAHVNGITAAYLLGPLQAGAIPYPNRLITFWRTQGMPQCPVNLFPPGPQGANGRAHIEGIFGHPVTFYATPISMLAPAHAGIPAVAVNEIRVPMYLINHIPFSSARTPRGNPFMCVWDTGATYNIVNREVAKEYGLAYEAGSRIILPQLDFLQANPPVSFLNVPAVVDNDFDQIVLGSIVLDHFTTIVLDFGSGVAQQPMPYVQGSLRLLP